MIDAIHAFGQGLMGGIWPATVWPVLWTLIKIMCVLLPLMGCVAYLTLWERKAIIALANINAGLLFLMAITSMEVYGVIVAGWASNSKYTFLGAMRASAQLDRKSS